MNEVYECDCREAAAASFRRIGINMKFPVLSSEELETDLVKLHKEMTTLKVILGAWRLAEEQRKEETTTEETTNPQTENK